ncbi:transcriptional regulator [Candidatus Gastranaerophilales bacterium]|nr:MAG: transcriptional regulator [Candidatus Gastranaerophilales bacterium]
MNNKTTKILQLGRNIFTKRKEKGFSQNQLAEKLDISREHLAKIETAKRCVSLGLLIDISEVLNVPVRDFFDF